MRQIINRAYMRKEIPKKKKKDAYKTSKRRCACSEKDSSDLNNENQ